MANRLRNRVAVVTGSGRGIGKEIAIAMAKEGAQVVTNDIIPGSAEATTREIVDMGGQAVPFTCDITDFESAHQLINKTVDSFGKIDILVNNAGVVRYGMIWELTEEDYDQVVDVSLKGAFNCTRHASGLMKEQGWGRIINASSSARQGMMRHANYCAAKAGIAGFTAGIALDLGKYGITCNAYCPGAATEIAPFEVRKAHFRIMVEAGQFTEQQYEDLLFHSPPPEMVAPFIVYLCTEEAGNINGQVFSTVGGRVGIYSEAVLKKSILKEEGMWTLEELMEQVPKVLLEGYKNPLESSGEWFGESQEKKK